MIQESSTDKRQSLYLYTDLNGMPEELTDEAGEIVWECSYQLWGKPVQEIAHTEIQ
ncbi:RHS domain-containing protein [Snodgrassella alvi]